MGEAPLGHDRAAARDDAGHPRAVCGTKRSNTAGVDGEVIHALFGLLDEGVAEDFPSEVFDASVDLFEGLIDRHGADRDRGIADDPLAGGVDVLAGGQVHDRVGAPLGGPAHLFDLLVDGGSHRRVADVGVDFHQEVAADDHRFGFRMVDVGRDDGATGRDLLANEFGGDIVRDLCPPSSGPGAGA